MEKYTFEVERREGVGSSLCRKYRREGRLPSVVYSHGEETIPTLVSLQEFVHYARLSTSAQIFSFKSSDPVLDGKSALIKEIRKDHVGGQVMHVDFQALKEDEEISVRIPLLFKGESVGVKLDGGILTVLTHDLGISCLPRLIPEKLEIDISELRIGNSIHASAVALPEGVNLEDDPEETIVSVVTVKIVEEATPEAAVEGAVPVEGTAGEAQAAAAPEGAAPAGKEKAGAPRKE